MTSTTKSCPLSTEAWTYGDTSFWDNQPPSTLINYRKPQKLTPRAKRAVARIMQYHIFIKHKPGILNKADALSRRLDYPRNRPSDFKTAFPDSMYATPIPVATTIPSVMTNPHTHHIG